MSINTRVRPTSESVMGDGRSRTKGTGPLVTSINGHLHYPNDIDNRSLNETTTDKIRKYRVDYNNNPLSSVVFMPTIPSTSGRLHSEFVCLLFLQVHRETDHFSVDSGVQLA